MKASRIYLYNKTKGELRHEHEVVNAKRLGSKHPGSKTAKTLHILFENNPYKDIK
jgi:hypothetical protein|nr:MAG TPA: hypothetical protein [Crassvirales sp.]